MNRSVTLDTEGNGLIKDGADTVWCAVAKDRNTGDIFRFYPEKYHMELYSENYFDYTVEDLPRFLEKCDNVCMHNGIDYDRRLIKRAFNYVIPLSKITDTLLLSQLLRPDRKVPEGWKGAPKPHSVEAYGMRFKRQKPEHDDWSKFSPEQLYRCMEDVEIQEMILTYLEKEAIK